MHRMIQPKSLTSLIAIVAFAVGGCLAIDRAQAELPGVVHADADYGASGYVTPAGMLPPGAYPPGAYPPGAYPGGIVPVGFLAGSCDGGCDAGSCDGGCGMGCGMGCGGSQCGVLGCGGILGKLRSEPNGGLNNLRHMCLFCRGSGCSACQSLGRGRVRRAIEFLMPYRDAGLCGQRWYDLSAEAVFLGHNNGAPAGFLTTLNPAPLPAGGPVPINQVVLNLDDADQGDDLELGARLSASVIFGPGGNLEVTYVGGNEWDNLAFATDAGAGLFSFISDFGRLPINGFDDTDRSLAQTVEGSSEFHTVELNYRRRTVGPYCRFQGSWLVGLRFLQFEDALTYSAIGDFTNTVNANLPRFFSSRDRLQNNLFGPQAGFDLWWNVVPGISLGMGA
ncbi:MAG: hypothetical protein MI861_02295, partial [Pirellulales bacterium]|nr:hypothetical protein [Pirellulales bacterium]